MSEPKYLNGKTVLKNDAVVYVTPKPESQAIVGHVHQIYERDSLILITGYPLRVPAGQVLLAQDAYATTAAPIRQAQAEAAAKAAAEKAAAEAAAQAQQTPAPTTPEPSPAPEPQIGDEPPAA